MKVLFITRKYPPQVGGMEKYSYELIKHFPGAKEIIALKKSSIHLLWFWPYALLKGIFLSRRVDLIHLGDGLLASLGLIIKKITRKPVLITAHGLDVTYNNWLYQLLNVKALKYLDRVIAVSNSTKEICLQHGVSSSQCAVIPNGIKISELNREFTRQDLADFLKSSIDNKPVLLTVGRLTKRKGVAWFIKEVLPKLDPEVIYLVVGAGPEKQIIERLIVEKNLAQRVFLLGQVSDVELELVYQTADVFVMPNIKVKGDLEGFGLVVLEAALHSLPVVAARLEGLQDAIKDKHNGFLVEPENSSEYVITISKLLANEVARKKFGLAAQKYTQENYSWDKIMVQYLSEFKAIL